jgi:hypothetical protein
MERANGVRDCAAELTPNQLHQLLLEVTLAFCNAAFILTGRFSGMMGVAPNFKGERLRAPIGCLELEVCVELEMRPAQRSGAICGVCHCDGARREPQQP